MGKEAEMLSALDEPLVPEVSRVRGNALAVARAAP